MCTIQDNLFSIGYPGWYTYRFIQLDNGNWLTAYRQLEQVREGATQGNTIIYRLWNPERNQVIQEFPGECSIWGDYACSLLNDHFAIGFADGIKIVNAVTNEVVR